MAGIYIHIPFCKKACHYCNFHFSTKLDLVDTMTEVIIKELDQRHSYLNTSGIETIYFGGGTPSVLSAESIDNILSAIKKYYALTDSAEISLEVNPDDISTSYLSALKDIGINRLSIGVQSFYQKELEFMNRSHDAEQALQSIIDIKNYFDNFSVDLIFGGQFTEGSNWENNLAKVIELDIPHLSCYSLTIEEDTVFGNWLKHDKLQAIDDDIQRQQFITTADTLEAHGYLHYEISNYAKPNMLAKHNTNYWKEKPYLGLGPSAHSYDGKTRQWNPSHNTKYITAINNQDRCYHEEALTIQDKYNEYILTGLRTMWGLDMERINSFGHQYQAHLTKVLETQINEGSVSTKDNHIYLTREGKLYADNVAQEFFYLEK